MKDVIIGFILLVFGILIYEFDNYIGFPVGLIFSISVIVYLVYKRGDKNV